MRSVIIGISTAAALVLLSGCQKHDESSKEKIIQSKPEAAVTIPEFGTFNTQASATAVVEPSTDGIVSITAPVDGSVEKISVGIGEHVAKGSPVVVLRSDAVSDVQSDKMSAKAAYDEAKRIHSMNQELYKLGAITANDLAASKANMEQSQAMVQGYSQKLSYYGASSGQSFTLRSPISGVVYEIDTHLGEKVGNDSDAVLVKIANPSKKMVVATVYEKDIPSFYIGKEVEIKTTASASETIKGTVSYISDVLDPESKTNKVYIQPSASSPNLRINMFVNVTVTTEQKNIFRIPKKSLLFQEGKFIVYVKQNDRFVPKNVTLISDDPKDDFSLVQGLTPNTPIALEAISMEKE